MDHAHAAVCVNYPNVYLLAGRQVSTLTTTTQCPMSIIYLDIPETVEFYSDQAKGRED